MKTAAQHYRQFAKDAGLAYRWRDLSPQHQSAFVRLLKRMARMARRGRRHGKSDFLRSKNR